MKHVKKRHLSTNYSLNLKNWILVIAMVLVGYSSSLFAQEENTTTESDKKYLSPEDYGKWESMGYRGSISDDGKWLIYSIRRNNEKNELRLHNLEDQSVKILPNSSNQTFSKDNQWLGYLINPAAGGKQSKKSAKARFRLLNLDSNDTLDIKNVASFSFSPNSKFLLLRSNNSGSSKSNGADIIIRNLSSGKHFSLGNVVEYSWQDEGDLLAFTVETAGKTGNGIQLFDGEKETIKLLDSEAAAYKGLTWRKGSTDLAIYRSKVNDAYEDSTYQILVWRNLGSENEKLLIFNQMETSGFPADTRLVNNTPLKWSKDGNSIFFNTKNWIKKPEANEDQNKDEDADSTKKEFNPNHKEAPGLQIWHSKDVRIIPEQVQRANRKRELSHLAVWHVNKNQFVQLGDDLTKTTKLQYDLPIVLGFDATPYEFDGMFGRGNSDIYSIDIHTGKKKRILEKVNQVYSMSPEGKALVYLINDNYHIYNFQTGKATNLTKDLDASFANLDDDHPVEQKPPYGFISWDKSGKSFFVHSKYDIWQINIDGSKNKNITNGASDQIIHRYTRIDREQEYIDLKAPIYVRRMGQWSKKSGYAKVIPGKKVKPISWGDVMVSRFIKAKHADRFAYVSEAYDDSPDYFANIDGEIKQVSETNPFQKDYYWGKSELIDYKNLNGRRLQGSLFYPDNYDPAKKYPMITYIYELRSHDIHRYEVPSQSDYYNHKVFTSQGYFVLQPDIVFDAGDPGISSVRTMEIAVKTVADKGFIDPDKVGLVGHSWGGYQSGFAVTQTDIFAAAVAGAGLTNLVSMYGMVAWSFGGTPESYHFEVSQERMQVPPYEDVEGYVRNSSVFHVDKMNTPLLFEVGDKDKNVDWRQGIELYNAARRAGKQMVMLVYANEGHGLSQDKNSYDYQQRILQWFGHYLKDEPAADWIHEGVPYTEQQKRLRNWNKGE